jgi:hypothetical protein
VTLDVLDVPSMAGKGPFLATHCERPELHDGVVTGCGEPVIVRREYGLEVERQSVPGREFPTRRTGPYATTLWHPLEMTSELTTYE